MEKLTAMLKRPRVWGFFLSLAICAVISLAFFAPDNFAGNSLRQPDMQQGAANGHEGLVYEQQSGEKALWTNSLFGGMPTFQISPSYPSNSLFAWLNGAFGLWLPAPSNLMMMMMFGFLILMFVLKKKWYIALAGAVAWAFSSYFIIIIGAGHIWKFVTLAYIPPTIAGLILLYRGKYLGGTALTALFAMLQLNANHPQMSYYFGIVMALIALAYLIEALRQRKIKGWLLASGLALAAGILAVGANAPALYNTYKYSLETQRTPSELAATDSSSVQASSGMPTDQILGWSYGRGELLSLLIPNIKGGASARPENGGMALASLADLPEAETYRFQQSATAAILQCLPQYFNDSEGTNGPVYAGAIIVALFLMGCFIVRGPLKWALVAATVISLALSLGYNAMGLSEWMIANFPMYNKFRAVESILVIAEFAMPLLGILALAQFLEAGKEALQKYRRPFWGSFGVCAAIAALLAAAPSLSGEAISERDQNNPNLQYLQYYYASQIAQAGGTQTDIEAVIEDFSLANPAARKAVEDLRYGMVRSDALRTLLFLLLGALVLAGAGCGKIKSQTLAGLLVALLVLCDLYTADKRYVSHSSFGPPVDLASQGIVPDEIDNAILAAGSGHYRVLDAAEFSDARRSYFHHMVGGYHAAKLRRTNDVVSRILLPAYSRGYFIADSTATSVERAADNVANLLNAKYVITGLESAPVIINSRAMGNAWFVDSIVWTDGALAEFDALGSDLDFRHQAVADRSFAGILGAAQPVAAGDGITLGDYTPNTLTYTTRSTLGGVAVFSEVYFPWGWNATIDGEPATLGRVNYFLRALAVPAGTHTVVLDFNPASVRRAVTAAYVCVILIYLLTALAAFGSLRRYGRP